MMKTLAIFLGLFASLSTVSCKKKESGTAAIADAVPEQRSSNDLNLESFNNHVYKPI